MILKLIITNLGYCFNCFRISVMKNTCKLPVFNISNFKDYNNCVVDFESNFYIREFKDHLKENCFLEDPHGHDFYLILIITKGSGLHYIDSTKYNIQPGAMFIISPGQIHKWELANDTDGYVLFFTKKYFLLDFNSERLTNLPFLQSTFSQPHILLNKSQEKQIINVFKKVAEEYSGRDLNYHELIRIYLNEMFIKLARFYSQKNNIKYVYTYELIQLNKFETLIDSNFKSHKPLSFYAEEMSISLKQLSYLCKKVIDKKPSEMITDRLILEAKRLIIHSDLSISSISNSLNFNDNSYFARMFKKICNQTPDQYRNSYSYFVHKNTNSNFLA